MSADDFGGEELELDVPEQTALVIPFPRMRPEPALAEQWLRERDAANQRLSKSYRFRGPLDALEELLRKRTLPPAPFPPEWAELAKRCALFPGELMAISGPSGGGKTSFAIQIARACTGRGVPVLWLPLELDDPEVNLRLVANMAGTHTLRIRESWTREQIAHNLTAVADRWHYVDRVRDPEAQVEVIRAAVQIAKRVYRQPPALFIDYIGKLARGARDPRLGLADRIEEIRAMTVEEECYSFLLSQTSRGNNAVLTGKVDLESAADTIGVSAETGELEHACSVTLALNVFKADDAEVLGAHVLVSKARGTGREGRQGYEFHKPGGVWKELDFLPPTPGEVSAEVKKQNKRKDAPQTDNATERESLNWKKQAESSAARKESILDALRRAGMFGLGGRELRKTKGAGNPKRLKTTLAELVADGSIDKVGNKWRIVPK
jgi:KaiC/GvpD/RAD55 family RecA-like ATPase